MNKIIEETEKFLIYEYKDNQNILIYRNKLTGEYFIFDADKLDKLHAYAMLTWSAGVGTNNQFRVRRRDSAGSKVSYYLLQVLYNLKYGLYEYTIRFINGKSNDYRKTNVQIFKSNRYIRVDNAYFLIIVTPELVSYQIKIDLSSIDVVKHYIWRISSRGYVETNISGKVVKIHRLILGLNSQNAEIVDHRDRDKLNNLKSNLYICTQRENTHNITMRSDNKSGRIGCYRRKMGNHYYWIAKWYPSVGVSQTKAFNCTKYGESEARILAENLRSEMEKQLGIISEKHP